MSFRALRGDSMGWDAAMAWTDLNKQRLRDKARRSRFKMQAFTAISTHLVWPRELCIGAKPIGRVLFLPGRDFKALNEPLEAKFMDGKTQRLWGWRLAYRDAYKALVWDIANQCHVEEPGGLLAALQAEAERRGLEWVP